MKTMRGVGTAYEQLCNERAISDALDREVLRLREKEEDLSNQLEDVINELDLSDGMIEKHGPLGTPPAEMVRLVLQGKDRKILMLRQGMKEIKQKGGGL